MEGDEEEAHEGLEGDEEVVDEGLAVSLASQHAVLSNHAARHHHALDQFYATDDHHWRRDNEGWGDATKIGYPEWEDADKCQPPVNVRLQYLSLLDHCFRGNLNMVKTILPTPTSALMFLDNNNEPHMYQQWWGIAICSDEEDDLMHLDGHTPLSAAAVGGHTMVVKWLRAMQSITTDFRPNPRAYPYMRRRMLTLDTPFHLAAEGGHLETLRALRPTHEYDMDLFRWYLFRRNSSGQTPVESAIFMLRQRKSFASSAGEALRLTVLWLLCHGSANPLSPYCNNFESARMFQHVDLKILASFTMIIRKVTDALQSDDGVPLAAPLKYYNRYESVTALQEIKRALYLEEAFNTIPLGVVDIIAGYLDGKKSRVDIAVREVYFSKMKQHYMLGCTIGHPCIPASLHPCNNNNQ